ncbi:uncharacterized protein B0I36DRAFT_366349 [Microdochium trichocladiopsis]|uniref:Uncharacterized protein n=1 Tax=Microdochium trichocladiopsis TaxID=1682393 RepID=A0A9P9BLH6_9PEZI|nr:uncharacterized protein B0I36DRAFT_366349 [Microdochium trichocladiopsis]KAH7024400.1 hypothetical protein B0I36DRAFT_366349 [Microdochium trichocladiopsis]
MAENSFNSFSLTLPSAPHRTQFPYPTYEEHVAAGRWIGTSIPLLHIFWLLNGPLETAVSLLSLQDGIIRQEPLFDRQTGKWHPVAECPVTDPKISSITVSVSELDDWDMLWSEAHWNHSDPHLPNGNDSVIWSISEEYRRRHLEWVDNEDEDDEDAGYNEDGAELVKCCGQDRPLNKEATIMVTPSAGGPDAGYVTIRDYVSASAALVQSE